MPFFAVEPDFRFENIVEKIRNFSTTYYMLILVKLTNFVSLQMFKRIRKRSFSTQCVIIFNFCFFVLWDQNESLISGVQYSRPNPDFLLLKIAKKHVRFYLFTFLNR